MCTEEVKMRNFEKNHILYVAKFNCTIGTGEHGEGRGRDGLPAASLKSERKDQGGGNASEIFWKFDGKFEFWQTKVKVVEREQQIAIQQQEIQRKEKELNSKVRKDITVSDFWTEGELRYKGSGF